MDEKSAQDIAMCYLFCFTYLGPESGLFDHM